MVGLIFFVLCLGMYIEGEIVDVIKCLCIVGVDLEGGIFNGVLLKVCGYGCGYVVVYEYLSV